MGLKCRRDGTRPWLFGATRGRLLRMSTELVIKLAGIFLGILARTLAPWLRKIREGRSLRFRKRYAAAAVASFLLGIIVTLVIFPQFDAAAPERDFDSLFKLFCLAFGFGFGWNAILLEGGEWAGALKPRRAAGQRDAARPPERNMEQEEAQ